MTGSGYAGWGRAGTIAQPPELFGAGVAGAGGNALRPLGVRLFRVLARMRPSLPSCAVGDGLSPSHLRPRHAEISRHRHAADAAEGLHTRLHRRIIAVSPSTALHLKGRARPNTPVHTICNGVNRTAAPETREEDYILFFGRLDIYNKGIDILLSAFARLVPAHPDVRLVLPDGVPARAGANWRPSPGPWAFLIAWN